MENVLSIISLAGGLALFLYGMTLLGAGLEKLSGGRLEKTLEKMTNNVFKGLLLGLVVTAAIQSSSATTVIVVGLVNAGVLKLRNAIGIIMGANIGTTVTSVILSVGDIGNNAGANAILSFLKPMSIASVTALVGIVIIMACKKTKMRIAGEICMGFGVLFTGMFLMTEAVSPLSELPLFKELFATLTNPFLGVLAGLVVTAIIQSSSASVGILQALASTGIISFSAAVPIIMGQNIGTCVTSLLSSIGANKNARRAAMVHLYFNIIGTILFMSVVYIIQYTVGFPFWNDTITMGGISLVHIIFNVATTIVFIPFTGVLEKLAVLTVRDRKEDEEEAIDADVASLDERLLRSPSMALGQSFDAIATMGKYAEKNFNRCVKMLHQYDAKKAARVQEYEDAIDRIEDKVNNYLVSLTDCELTDQESREITYQLKLTSEFERIGDYSVNLLELAEKMSENNVSFSEKAAGELTAISEAVEEIIQMSLRAYTENDLETAGHVEPLEEVIDMMEDRLKVLHIERLKDGKCTIDAGLIFLEALTNLERIADHCSNIAVYIIGHFAKSDMNRHDYLRKIHDGTGEKYRQDSALYLSKYYSRIDNKQTVI